MAHPPYRFSRIRATMPPRAVWTVPRSPLPPLELMHDPDVRPRLRLALQRACAARAFTRIGEQREVGLPAVVHVSDRAVKESPLGKVVRCAERIHRGVTGWIVQCIAAAIADNHVEARRRHSPRWIERVGRAQPVVIRTVRETGWR